MKTKKMQDAIAVILVVIFAVLYSFYWFYKQEALSNYFTDNPAFGERKSLGQ